MTKSEVLEGVKSLRENGWSIIDVIDTRKGYAIIAADTVDDHMTYETLADALDAGLA